MTTGGNNFNYLPAEPTDQMWRRLNSEGKSGPKWLLSEKKSGSQNTMFDPKVNFCGGI